MVPGPDIFLCAVKDYKAQYYFMYNDMAPSIKNKKTNKC